MQLMSVAAALLLLQVAFLNLHSTHAQALVFVTFSCLLWHAWWIAPYTRIWPVEVKGHTDQGSKQQISLLTANVLTSNRNSEALLALIAEYQPDVVATLESDAWWEAKLDTLESEMPHTIKCPQENLYGMHLYSRLPISEPEIAYLVEEEVPSIHGLLHLDSGEKVRIHVLHPAPPSPTENAESAERDAELIIVARSVADSDLPTIVTGDLNDVAWSSTTRLFRKISGLLDPRVGRGLFNTFHAAIPLLRWPLDHVFHSRHFSVETIERLPAIGSDHFPLFARLSIAATPKQDETPLSASEDDEARADSIARNRGAHPEDVPTPGNGNVDRARRKE